MNVCIILLLLKIVFTFCTIIVVRFQVYCRSFLFLLFTPTEILHEHKSKCCLFLCNGITELDSVVLYDSSYRRALVCCFNRGNHVIEKLAMFQNNLYCDGT